MPDDQTVNPVANNQSTNPLQSETTDPSMQTTVTDIEKELLNEIIVRLKEDKMSPQEAQQLAKDFLALLPFHDQKDLLEKLKKLSQTNYAASGVYLHYATPHEEQERQQKLELMSKHIQEGNIEHALTVAKGGTPNGG